MNHKILNLIYNDTSLYLMMAYVFFLLVLAFAVCFNDFVDGFSSCAMASFTKTTGPVVSKGRRSTIFEPFVLSDL